jgi:hypothetical protein
MNRSECRALKRKPKGSRSGNYGVMYANGTPIAKVRDVEVKIS